jgi:HSP20 family molecular chaperone IbpA
LITISFSTTTKSKLQIQNKEKEKIIETTNHKTMIFLTPQQSFSAHPAFDPRTRELVLKKMMHNCQTNEVKSHCLNKKDNLSRIILERNPIHHENTSEAATISLDVAGFTIDDIDIQVEDHIVCISAERKNKLGDVFQVHRRFRLDEKTADEEGICATITDGVLQIVVQKKTNNAGPRVIPISISINKKDEEDVNPKSNEEESNSKDEAIKDEKEERKSIEVETVVEGNGVLVTEEKKEVEEIEITSKDEAWEEVSK